MGLMTRSVGQTSGPAPEEVVQRVLSPLRGPVHPNTKQIYLRVCRLPRRDETQVISIAVYYSRGDRWFYCGIWHVTGAEHIYEGVAGWIVYGRKATARSLCLAP